MKPTPRYQGNSKKIKTIDNNHKFSALEIEIIKDANEVNRAILLPNEPKMPKGWL